MDPHQSFPFGWGNHGPTYNHQVHGLVGGAPQLPSDSSASQAPFPSSYQLGMSSDLPPIDDSSMNADEVEEQPAPLDAIARPKTRSSHRAKREHLDWNAYKDAIWSLYVDQNKTLSETMEAMDNVYSFKASPKLYKSKFKEWNWQKNLPTDTALQMTAKAKRRKLEENKDTVFSFGGRLWDTDRIESTLSRVKRSSVSENLEEADTPKGVSYKTPKALAESPAKGTEEHSDVEMIKISNGDPEDDSDDHMDSGRLDGRRLTLTWQGLSRTDLQDMWRRAINLRNTSRANEAEEMLNRVFLGMGHVLGKTNMDTVKVAYNLADIYADSGRMNQAIAMIEKMIEYHLITYGHEDQRTQQHVLQAVELLNSWNRQADALGLLSLSEELLHSSSGALNARKADNHTSKKGKAVQRSMQNGYQAEITKALHSVLEDSSPAGIDYGLGVGRTHVAAKDRAAEGLLQAIILQCQDNHELVVQHLKAQAELLRLYDKLDEVNEHGPVFVDAMEHLERAWEVYEWTEDSIESFDFLEAALQLIADFVKCGYERQAKHMFGQASEKASELFGSSDERTVWVLISIGLVYQTHKAWSDAEEWFEQAFSAALANDGWGPKDGIVRSLQNAMDHHHFSYVSDEGRPFKSIFGVSGITITPGRLHLE